MERGAGRPTNSAQLISTQPNPSQPGSTQISKSDTTLRFQKSCHPPSNQNWVSLVPISLAPVMRLCSALVSSPSSDPAAHQAARAAGTTYAVCTKYRYGLHVCREGLRHQTSTNPPPTTKADATPGGPTPTIEARHLQFISTLVLPGCPVLVCRRPCVSRPTPPIDRRVASSHQTHAPPPGHLLPSPPVPFNSSRPVVPIPRSLPLVFPSSISACVSCPPPHPPPPLNPNASWLAPAFAASACAASLHMLLVRDGPRSLSTAGLLRDSTKPLGLDWLGPWSGEGVCVCVNERTRGVCGVCLGAGSVWSLLCVLLSGVWYSVVV